MVVSHTNCTGDFVWRISRYTNPMEPPNEIEKALARTEIMPCLTSILNLMLVRHVVVEY